MKTSVEGAPLGVETSGTEEYRNYVRSLGDRSRKDPRPRT